MPEFPDDIEQLKRLLTESRAALAAASAQLRSRDLEIEALKLQLAVLQRMRFGRRSERLDAEIAQLQLALETMTEAEAPQVEAPPEQSDSPLRSKPARRPLPAHLPRDEQRHKPEHDCPECGGALKPLGEDITEILDYVPGRFCVIREVRPKLSCGQCAKIVQCTAPPRPIAPRQAPGPHLAHFKGLLQADAFAGFNGLYARQPGPLVEVACWAHVRRKFYDLHAAHGSPLAKQALERIGALYRIEDGIRGRPPDERRAVRQARAGPLLEELCAWLEAIYATLSKKRGLAQAIRYALARWPALTRYRDDGRLEIDNNAAERALRPVALGRKSYVARQP